jgi:hypothetical protein
VRDGLRDEGVVGTGVCSSRVALKVEYDQLRNATVRTVKICYGSLSSCDYLNLITNLPCVGGY